MLKENKLEKFVKERGVLSLASDVVSLGAGIYHGFMDACGNPIEGDKLEFALKYGPAITTTMVFSAGLSKFLWKTGFTSEQILEAQKNYKNGLLTDKEFEEISSSRKNIYTSILGGTTAAIPKGVLSGIETAIGYSLGYLTGKIIS